jgi:hypothetical protein
MKRHCQKKNPPGRPTGKRPLASPRQLGRIRPLWFLGICLLVAVCLPLALAADLQAFSIVKSKVFTEGDYTFQMEIQIYGSNVGKKKIPFKMSSLKVKIKNKRASSDTLKVHAIRAHLSPDAHQDIETKGYPISPGQWVTKFYRLPERKRPIIGEQGFIEIAFEPFTIRFNLRDRTFQGPVKK